MGITLGVVGAGSFAQCFIPLFQAHPLVDEVVLCDLVEDKVRAAAERFGVKRTAPSLDLLLETDVSAVAVITQHWLHAPQAIRALEAGRDVYSAVPAAASLEEIADLVAAVERSGRIYMMGETSYYRPTTILCRDRLAEGMFGAIVYSEGQYYHDFDHGLYDVVRNRVGEGWERKAGWPPMHYPTHSVGAVLAVTRAFATHVSCAGYVDHHADGIFAPGMNDQGNTFSNETALFQLSDGSSMRINEFRRIGHPGLEGGSIYGTEGAFESGAAGSCWLTKSGIERVDDLVRCTGVAVDPAERGRSDVPRERTFVDCAPAHPVDRLPVEFAGLPNGHGGSHQFLVHEFVSACVERRRPAVDVWQAARYTAPGLVAHESAIRGGALLPIPDHGEGAGR